MKCKNGSWKEGENEIVGYSEGIGCGGMVKSEEGKGGMVSGMGGRKWEMGQGRSEVTWEGRVR